MYCTYYRRQFVVFLTSPVPAMVQVPWRCWRWRRRTVMRKGQDIKKTRHEKSENVRVLINNFMLCYTYINTYVITYLYVYIQRFTYVEIFDIYDQLVTIGMSTLHLLISIIHFPKHIIPRKEPCIQTSIIHFPFERRRLRNQWLIRGYEMLKQKDCVSIFFKQDGY